MSNVQIIQKKWRLPASLLAGAVEWWSLSEPSGVRVGSINRLNLTDNAGVAGYPGVNGTLASAFNAANTQYLSRTSEAALQTGNISFTFVAWVYPDSLTGTQVIVSKDNSVAGTRDYELAPFNSNLEFNLFTATDVNVQASISSAMVLSKWQMCIGWFDATLGQAFVERNANGVIGSSTAGNTLQAASNSEFRIGARQFSGSQAPFNGKIQKVGFWKRVLTPYERTLLYNQGNGLNY
jgi:concanavalin A-like lectin/glucanase superfamily protein